MLRTWKNKETGETRKAQFKPAGFGWYEVGGLDDEDGLAIAVAAATLVAEFINAIGNDDSFSGGGGDFGGGGDSGDW